MAATMLQLVNIQRSNANAAVVVMMPKTVLVKTLDREKTTVWALRESHEMTG